MRSLKEIRDPKCKDCELSDTAEFVCLPGFGKVPSKIMLIGEAPGHREDSSGIPFVGRAGKLLDAVLDQLGLSRDQLYITNAVHCRPPDNRTPSMQELRACRPYLLKEIDLIKPQLIITLGYSALKGLFNSNTIATARERGKILKFNGIKVVATYHPAAALRKAYYANLIFQDIQMGLENLNHNHNSQGDGEGTYTVERDTEEVFDYLYEAKEIAVDLETTSLDCFDPQQEVICIGLSVKEKEACSIIYTPTNLTKISRILNHKEKVIGHNIKFDLKWLISRGGRVKPALFDTMVAMHLLDENYPDKSLKHLTRIHFPILSRELDRTEARVFKSKEKPTISDWTIYNCMDADATFRLYHKLKKKLGPEGFNELMDQEMKVLKVLTYIEMNGFKIDRAKLTELKRNYEQDIGDHERKLKKYFGDINFNSSAQVGKVLFRKWSLPVIERTPTGEPSCNEKSLSTLRSIPIVKGNPVYKYGVGHLLKYRNKQKLYTTYIDGLIKGGLIKKDGKVHCNYKITGTVTGRLSCSDPNLQNPPREGDIKLMFVSSFHRGKIIQADYSQAELRLLAHYSKDPALIQAFKSGRDIHQEVAAKVFKKAYDEVTEVERKFTKQVNFGIIYLISDKGLAEKIGCSEREAGHLKIEWFKEFPDALKWIQRMKVRVVKDGYTTNIFGRKRHFFGTNPDRPEGREDQRQGVNSPIQGGAGDLTKWAMYKVFYAFRKRKMLAKVVGNVHDAILVDSPREEVAECASILREICTNPPVPLLVPMEVEVKIGDNWGTLKKGGK